MTDVVHELAGYATGVDAGYASVFGCTDAGWPTEVLSCAALDEAISATGLFRIEREVPGRYLFSRPERNEGSPRIDRVLIPTLPLIDRGWDIGPIGVECKRSGEKLGRPIAQILSYKDAIWRVGRLGAWVYLPHIFLWPWKGTCGPLASIVAQSGIGGISLHRQQLCMHFSTMPAYAKFPPDGSVNIDHRGRTGRKVGSR